jgi:dihydroorotate dehydrogenase
MRQPKRSGLPSLFAIPVGMSVAMTNCQENADLQTAVQDYAKAFRTMEPYASYRTLNISCPNTFGGQPFVDPVRLEALLSVLDTIPTKKPVFIKLSPDLDKQGIDALLAVASAHRVDGIVCTNLTKKRDNDAIVDENVPDKGGLGGKVVQEQSDDLLAYVYRTTGNRFVLVGVGGIFSAEDAYRKIRLGASLVQLITGMVFQGPQLISQINQGLVELLKRDGFANVSDAIGVDAR